MDKIKLTIVYYSMTGTNYQLAKWAEEGALEAGAEVRLVKAQELAPELVINNNPKWKAHIEETKDIPVAASDDLVWADAIIVSSPSRFGNIASQIKQFMDMQGGIWAQGKLTNKVVSAMSSAQNPHGGQEATIKSIYTSMMHWGAIIVPLGGSDESVFRAGGNPYGTSVTVGENGMIEDVKDSAKYQGRRTVEVAKWIKKGME